MIFLVTCYLLDIFKYGFPIFQFYRYITENLILYNDVRRNFGIQNKISRINKSRKKRVVQSGGILKQHL